MTRDRIHPGRPATHRAVRGLAAAVVASAALAGCANSSAPLSFLNDEQVTQRAQLHRYPVFVTAVDGRSTGFRPVPISPGQHLVTMDAPPVGGLTQPVQKTIPMTIEPCTRYYLAAQRDSALTQDWHLVIEDQLPVGGCNPDEERRKALTDATSPHSTLASPVVAR